VSVPVRATSDLIDEWQQIMDVHEENELLRAQIQQNALDRYRLNQLEYDNRRLQKSLDFTNSQKALHDYKFYYADVISYSSDFYNHTIVINLGEKDGVRVDMPVVSVEGLVGRVQQVSQYYATVQLLLDLEDDKSSKPIPVTVRGKEKDSFGIIEQYDRKKKVLRMTKIESLDPLNVGDEVVTSGLGELFPSGLVIGKITYRKVGDFGITHVAEIKPNAAFSKLREVFVVEVPVKR
jgi:rod shape-determining protein MreC